MADAIGISGIHNVSGRCDLCGRGVDAVTEELNALDCTYQDCPPLVYHQDCLEKYLKSIRLEKNRKTGFKCPRGSGKGTSFKEACPGKIDKSHPIHPRNDFGKKRRKAKPPPDPLPRQKPVPKKEKEKGKDKDKESKADKSKDKAKPKSGVVIKALNVSNVSLVKNVKPTVGRSVSLSGDMLKVQSESRKSMSSTSSAYSSTASASGLENPDGMRTGSMPLFSAWSKPMSTAAQSQVPDMNSMTAFPPALIGSASEETKNISRTSQNCWANASRVQSGSHVRSMSVNDAALQGGMPQSQSLPNSGSMSIGNTGELPVGMDYADGMGVEGKLTKAQKKNMKRAEKKKKNMTETPVSSSPTSSSTAPASASATPVSQTPGTQTPIELSEDGSSPLFSSQDNSTNSVLSELCVDTLVAWKTMYHIQQLQKLGFEPWQSAAAICRYGGNLEHAIAWLLDYNGENDEEQHTALDVVPEVDVSSELSYLQEVQETFSLPECVLEQAVVDCNGDLDAAIPTVLGSREDLAGELKGTSSRPLSPDIQVEASPFAGGFPAGQPPPVAEMNGNHMEGLPNSEMLAPSLDSLTKSMETVVEAGWPTSLSEQFMLGGVLGSTLEEYKSGNMDFTALASKGFRSGLRPAPSPDANVLGLQGMRTNMSPTSRLDLLGPGQTMYRNLSPGGVRSGAGLGNVITDVGHYNRILSRDNSAPLGSSGFGVSAAGLTSSWNLGGGAPFSFSNAPQLGAENGQEDQQDWRHFIGNLLEG
ncbi:hypothetical protein BSKO_07083 [Bryopsis sp. KO-2023]|nr:hypothetical protein BSKO_07083 [Bryopsis sp. KO-2023]